MNSIIFFGKSELSKSELSVIFTQASWRKLEAEKLQVCFAAARMSQSISNGKLSGENKPKNI